jgi:hypothetical protein
MFRLLMKLRILMNFPGFDDREEFRDWLKAVLEMLDGFAKQTETKVDDAAIDIVEALVNSPAFETVMDLIASDTEPDSGSPLVGEVGEKTGIDPATILLIIQAIRMLIGFIRGRRENR